MVEHQLSLKQASIELELELTQADCDRILKRKTFQEALRDERNRFLNELANQPGRSKATAVGAILQAIEKLSSAGEWDKVVTAVEKLAKIEGWLGADSTVQIFAGLSQKDIAEAKQRIQRELSADRPAEPTPEVRPN